MQELIADFKKDLPLFCEATEKFYRKEMSIKDYKSISGGYGSYAQRGADKSMLRLRFCGGHVTLDQLAFVVDTIKKYQINMVHFTTCQSMQLHNLDALAVCEIVEDAYNHDIVTRGGGGDYPRNVMVSPLTGVDPEEYFDVYPYAKACADYLLSVIKKVQLPRKLKVGFSNSVKNDTHPTFRDLGFVAKADGNFDVYSAGGLGNNPSMGVRVAQGVKPGKILYHVKAMIQTFIAYGDYVNRSQARTRYMQSKLGQAEYVKAYLAELAKVEAAEQLDIAPEAAAISKTGIARPINHPRIAAQKQTGLYYVTYHPIGGTPTVDEFIRLYEAMKTIDGAELRIAPDETAYIINLTIDEAEKIATATENTAANLLETSVACVGNAICQIGLQDSYGLLKTVIAAVRPYQFKDGVLPRLHISGCSSSCGTHQIGSIGFHGGVKLVDKKPQPAFHVFVNGSENKGEERFGTMLGIMTVANIPAFLIAVGETIAAADETFAAWYPKHAAAFKALAERYTDPGNAGVRV